MMFNNDISKMDRETRNALSDLLSEMIINDPNSPEGLRTATMIIHKSKHFSIKLFNFVSEEYMKISRCDNNETIEKAKEIVEYIDLMSAGLDSFIEVWKHE